MQNTTFLFRVRFLTLSAVMILFCNGCGMFSIGGAGDVVEELGYGEEPAPLTLEPGETLRLVVRDPGDGGYVFRGTVFDPEVLDLMKVYDEAPETGMLGDFGARHFIFRALQSGETEVVIKIERPGQAPEEYQRQPVTVE